MQKNELKIEYISVDELKPYEKNARHHTKKDIDLIKNSIYEFGMNDPIGVWKDNIIVEGHGRLEACKQLGMKTVPIVRLDHLTDEERRAYTLAHNRTAQMSTWDNRLVKSEIKDIFKVDMGKFGFDMQLDPNRYFGDARERTFGAYNLDLVPETLSSGFWQMPMLEAEDVVPDDLIGFKYAKTNESKSCGIHFYIDDYQFERVWNYPDRYVDILKQYQCILSPDFSLYMDMPMPMKIWNTYRNRQIGSFYQSEGIHVIPSVGWAEKETYQFCFEGLPKNATLSVSTVGVMRDEDALEVWKDGMTEMIKRLKPKRILVYGSEIPYDYGNVEVVYYRNKVMDKWRKK